jgi:ABC-type antimicrobial peptide transport system permease subunit
VTVVGVVTDVRYVGVDKPDQGTVYAPMDRQTRSRFALLRTSGDPAAVIAPMRQTVRELDASLPLSRAATMDDLIGQSLQKPRSLSILVGAFALVALTLSIVGIYGVMAYYVQQHAKDISIRLALGGRANDVLRLVVGQGMRVVAIGLVLGLLVALGVTRLIGALLYGVGTADVRTFGAVSLLLLGIALLACLVPAWRAVGVEPAMVLRDE